ncbi:helix-turn-helix transcriptional regulator [Sporomusa aerivorans]|uniref:helix-turn-helix transcriptional regulator n=1 Tax=Sporomusa aerivorans TaxID=204936 RepID=UPI003529F0B8
MKYEFDTEKELIPFIVDNIITTREAMEILGCSRQNIDDLIKRGKLAPIKKWDRDKLFWKEDVLDRLNRLSK